VTAETDKKAAKYILKDFGRKNVLAAEKHFGEISNMRAANETQEVMLLL
jgi:hypothetical protein